MKNKLLTKVMLPCLLLIGSIVYAQTVSGVVSDALGPIPGVNVLVKGTTTGTQTDFDGNYSLDVGSAEAVLVFSFIGYATQEIPVNGQSTINITLAEDIAALDEVVIIGYGQTTIKDATGSVASVKSGDFNKGVVTTADQLIQGRVSGVQVTASSGEPGAAANIRVRGTSSIRAGNDPLYVVDGFPLGGGAAAPGADVGLGRLSARNPLSFINPSDIASIDILKDASATAIYGSRGANGVIIITTKRGKTGAPQISWNSSVQFSSIANEYDLIKANDYPSVAAAAGNANPDSGARVDPMDAILRNAVTQQHDFSYGAGTDNSNYRISLGLLDQEGIVKGTGQEKYSFNLNMQQKAFNDRVKFDTSFLYTFYKDDGEAIADNVGAEGDLMASALKWNPTLSFYNADGSYRQPSDNQRNPLALLDYYTDITETSRILGNVSATVNIIEGLDYKFTLGVDRSESRRRVGISSDFNTNNTIDRGIAGVEYLQNFSKLFEHTLSYKTDLTEDLVLDAVLGYGFGSYSSSGNRSIARDFSIPDQEKYIKDLGYASTFSPSEQSAFTNPDSELQSFFARANFNYLGKYLLTGTIRADGSSKFGENNQYGYFPSFGAAWRLSDEDFIPETFSNLKLRLNWGITGNQEFAAGSAQTQFGPTDDGVGLQQTNVANPDLKWESTVQYGVGVDFGFLNGRLSGTMDYFHKETKDLLFRLPAIQPAPNVNYWTNFDDITVINSGFEFAINASVINNEDWTFDTSFNISFLDNEIKNVSNQFPLGIITGQVSGRSLSGQNAQLLYDNQPLYAFYLPIFEGYDSSGNPTYRDVNGDGVINPNFDGPGTTSDRTFVGDPNPDILVGIAFNASYKKFDFNANLNGAYGHKVLDNTAMALFYKAAVVSNENATYAEANSNANPAGGPFLSTKDLKSGDFLRLSNITLGYTLSSEDMKADWIQSLRLYVTGQNLFVITPYDGFDPEVNKNKEVDGVPSFGIDYMAYPRSKGFLIGLNANF
jgi:iron complex outermembrane receptor protein